MVVVVLPLTSIEKFDPFFPAPNIKAGKSPLHESVNTSPPTTLHIQTDFLLASSAPALRRFELSIMLATAASFTASSRMRTFEYNLPKSPSILLLHFQKSRKDIFIFPEDTDVFKRVVRKAPPPIRPTHFSKPQIRAPWKILTKATPHYFLTPLASSDPEKISRYDVRSSIPVRPDTSCVPK